MEQLSPRLAALSSATRRLGECQQLEEDVANLKEQQQVFVGKATERQSTLESLLALWQRCRKKRQPHRNVWNITAFCSNGGHFSQCPQEAAVNFDNGLNLYLCLSVFSRILLSIPISSFTSRIHIPCYCTGTRHERHFFKPHHSSIHHSVDSCSISYCSPSFVPLHR